MASAYVHSSFDGGLPSTVTGCSITLHLYRPSGEFVCEHSVFVGMGVDVFTQALEEGLVTPELNLQQHDRFAFFNRHAGFDLLHRDYIYSLVWKGMVLADNTTFADYILDHGMSIDEPNDICVVTKEYVLRAP